MQIQTLDRIASRLRGWVERPSDRDQDLDFGDEARRLIEIGAVAAQNGNDQRARIAVAIANEFKIREERSRSKAA